MDFYSVINSRHTVREFTDKKVENEKVLRILEAGLAAPSHNHLRQWEYLLIDDPATRLCIVESGEHLVDEVDVDQLRKKFENMDPKAREMYLHANTLQKKMIISAPELLIICYQINKPIKDCNNIYELNSLASVWCVIENILLAMTYEGLGGVTYIPQHTHNIRKILDIPEKYEIPVLIPFGYPNPAEKKVHQVVVHVADRIHHNKF
jgi:nitroreductase